jgi:hypothetical protein
MKTIMRSMIVLLSLTGLLIVSSPRAEAAVCTWNGTAGDWNVAANWNNCNGVIPGASDEAIISSGTVNLTEDASVGSLTMSGGTLTGPHDLTAGTINWSGGTMSGTGSTTATDAASFTGSSGITLNERTFNNAGSVTWNKTGYLNLQTASTVFNNQAGATFTVQSSGETVMGGSGTFSNAGTLNLTTGKINVGTFVQETGATTNLTISGITPVTDYCQINASVVDLTGPLNVSFSSGYTPQVGDRYVLLSYSSTRTGDFSPVDVTPIAGIYWTLYYEDSELYLWATTRIYIPMVVR